MRSQQARMDMLILESELNRKLLSLDARKLQAQLLELKRSAVPNGVIAQASMHITRTLMEGAEPGPMKRGADLEHWSQELIRASDTLVTLFKDMMHQAVAQPGHPPKRSGVKR